MAADQSSSFDAGLSDPASIWRYPDDHVREDPATWGYISHAQLEASQGIMVPPPYMKYDVETMKDILRKHGIAEKSPEAQALFVHYVLNIDQKGQIRDPPFDDIWNRIFPPWIKLLKERQAGESSDTPSLPPLIEDFSASSSKDHDLDETKLKSERNWKAHMEKRARFLRNPNLITSAKEQSRKIHTLKAERDTAKAEAAELMLGRDRAEAELKTAKTEVLGWRSIGTARRSRMNARIV